MAKDSLPQDLATEIGVEDLYEFLGVSSASTEKEITRGYRKKALKYHPDKNPDDPKAADLFQKLSKAYSILTDPAAKGAYDKWLKAKHAAKQRHDELNAKRRKLKESLESKESQFAAGSWVDEREAARRMQKEIERLREEGFQKIKEQEVVLRQQFQTSASEDDILPTLKVTWKVRAGDQTNGGYSSDTLTDIFAEYGPVHHVLVSSKRNGKALISFHHHTDLLSTLESGIGSPANPLKIVWVSGDPGVSRVSSGGVTDVLGGAMANTSSGVVTSARNVMGTQTTKGQDGLGTSSAEKYLDRGSDYESVTLMRLRQAEERKRLCQQLQEQEEPS